MKTAVVLGGGGARGAFQIGVWQALKELDIDYQIVTGTSVGALNGALMVLGEYDKAKEMWENLTNDTVVSDLPAQLDYESYLGKREVWTKFVKSAIENGGMDTSPLEQVIESVIDENLFLQSPVEFGLVTVEYPSFKPMQVLKKNIPKGMLKYYLLASAACFPAFKAVTMNDGHFIDGGYANNIPADLALECGAENIIEVDIKGLGVVKKLKNKKTPVKVITSQWDLGPIFLFSPEAAKRNIRLGYLEAMKAYDNLEGDLYTFAKGETAKLSDILGEQYALNAKSLLAVIYEKQNKALEFVLWRKLTGLCGCKSGDIKLSSVLIKSAELAMKIYGLSPLDIYTAQSAIGLLLAQYKKNNIISFADIEKQLKAQVSVKLIAESLKMTDNKIITAYICDIVKKALQGEKLPVSLALVSAVFSYEFAAAVFIVTAQEVSQ